GQEFSTYAVMLGEDEQRLKEAVLLVCEINMGATAIGTGINSHPDYAASVCRHLRDVTGIPVVTAANLVEATQDCGSFVQLSGVLKRVAVKLSKTCNDLRLLSSGPRVGLNEINLPPMQAGSSIMPGKVNPYIGYANATEIAQQALLTDKSVYDLVLEKQLLTREQLDQILQPEVLTRPRSFDVRPAPAETNTLSKRPSQID